LKKFNKIPFSYVSHVEDTNITDKKLISYDYVSDDRKARELFDIQEHCINRECKMKNCKELIFQTKTEEEIGESFRVKQMIPEEPWTESIMFAVLEPLNFFTYVTSVIATYTGCSFFIIRPSNLKASFELLTTQLFGMGCRQNHTGDKTQATTQEMKQDIRISQANRTLVNLERKFHCLLSDLFMIMEQHHEALKI
jgi:hypothetical protein